MTNRLNDFADNVWAKIAARYVTPILAMFLMAVGGYLLGEVLSEVKTLNAHVNLAINNNALMRQEFTLIQRTRDGEHVTIHRQLDDHETRIRILERPGGPR